ncbi:MAG: dihydrodipicolinate synthase family protein [Chthoniobacter sp.]|nr:dihydrodipicolinate synthase family protein [Chthoniobacter sp.]
MILPVFQTPFHEDESVDFGTLERELHWLLDEGADGVVMAMVSETLRLASDERDAVCAFVCQAIGQRGATVISVGAESSHVAERHARHAEQCGATMLMAIPPVAVVLDEEAITDYYRRLIRAVKIPVIVQDASGYVGRPMSIEVQVRLMEEFGPERVQFKPEAPPLAERLGQLRAASGQRAKCYEGSGGVALIETFPFGLAGTMPGADLIRGIVPLWRALQRGDAGTARAIHAPLAKLTALQTTLDAYLAVEKHLLVRQGIFRNTIVRGPVGWRLSDDLRVTVDLSFEEFIAAIP